MSRLALDRLRLRKRLRLGGRQGASSGAGVGVQFATSILAYWSANNAVASGGLINSVSGMKSRNLAKIADANRPTLSAGRMVFTNAAATRLIEGGALQTLKMTAAQVVALPDGTGCDSGKGFTPTGAVTAPDGTRWVANFGLPVQASPATPAPSLVHMSADFSTKLDEIPFASMTGNGGVVPVGGIQGLAYDPTDNTLVFWANNQVWFVSTAGAIMRTVAFTAFSINGICYFPPTDEFIVFAAPTDNATLRWMNKATGALGRSVPIYGNVLDHAALSPDYRYLWYSGGANGGTAGGAIRQLDLITEKVVGEWFTDSGAPEGIIYIDGSTFWLVDDGYHHSTNTVNTARRYLLDPAAGVYPGAGRKYVLAGVAKLDTAIASTVALVTIGEPTVASGRGVGIFFNNGSTTGLRYYINGSLVDFTVPSTTTEFLYSFAVDDDAQTVALYFNGVLISNSAITGLLTAAFFPSMQVMLGSTRNGAAVSNSSNSRMANVMIINDLAMREAAEGEVAWDAGRVDLLPVGHLYKTARPSLAG